MKKIVFCLSFLFLFFAFHKTVNAQVCSNFQVDGNIVNPGGTNQVWADHITINFKVNNVNLNDTFLYCTDSCRQFLSSDFVKRNVTARELSSGSITFRDKANTLGKHVFHIRNEKISGSTDICTFEYTVKMKEDDYGDCQLNVASDIVNGKTYTPDNVITVNGKIIPYDATKSYSLEIKGPILKVFSLSPDSVGSFSNIQVGRLVASNQYYTATLYFFNDASQVVEATNCQKIFNISYNGGGLINTKSALNINIKNICSDDKSGKCEECFSGNNLKIKGRGVWTALGCIPVEDLNEFIKWVLTNFIFISTGIAFLLMASGAIQILTSSGNPESVKSGGNLITSALSGLLLIIFALFLLKLIGVDILQIPGFNK